MENTVLVHHGTKGMRWGVRRYQNKDGSLTAAGKKRRSLGEVIHDRRVAAKRKKALEKARATKAANKEAAEKRAKDVASGKISAKKMTDAEIEARINRLNLEKRYKEAMEAVKDPTSAPSRGKTFVDKYIDSTLEKLAENVGADVTAQTVKVLLVDKVNATLGKEGVYTNNKRKN